MQAYTPHFAPVAVMAFLGTGLCLGLSLIALVYGVLAKSRTFVLSGIAVGAAVVTMYGAMLLGLSLSSSETNVPRGAWKYFCEIDCHIAYAVEDVKIARSVGPESRPIGTTGKFVIVQLKTWFDPSTTSPHRGDAPLTPNGRRAVLLDGAGRKFDEFSNAESVLTAAGLQSSPLRTALRPGETYVSYLVFEVPADSSGLRLLLTSADEETFLIWGHENSPLHKKAYFLLPTV
jgi:hypothetical protein